jgi:hypothetical protein
MLGMPGEVQETLTHRKDGAMTDHLGNGNTDRRVFCRPVDRVQPRALRAASRAARTNRHRVDRQSERDAQALAVFGRDREELSRRARCGAPSDLGRHQQLFSVDDLAIRGTARFGGTACPGRKTAWPGTFSTAVLESKV